MRIDSLNLGSVTEVASGRTLSGEQLGTTALRRAAWLLGNGISPGDRIVIAHGGTADFFGDLLAVWHVGAVAACVNPGVALPELRNVCQFLDTKLVLTAGDLDGDPGAPVGSAVLQAKGDLAASVPGGLDDPALILFTSGTTGDPKGVVHTFRSLLARVTLNRAYLGDEVLQRTLCVLPTHFGHGLIGNCLTPLLAGHDLSLFPGMGLANASRLPDVIDEREITFLSSVPALWKLALRVAKSPVGGSLEQVSVGSAPLSADLWEAMADWAKIRNVVNMYGITEAANWISGASLRDHEPQDGLIGRPFGGAFAVRDGAGRVSACGEGELLVFSPSLMSGYFSRPDLTAEVLLSGWFATGDVGTVSPDGTARLTGRIKHEINRAGMKIHPEDVDLLLERHSDVVEACAFGIPDPVSGEIVGVAVRAIPGAELDVAILREWAGERVRREAVPERWFIVAEIPKTDRGKVKRELVRDFCLGGGK
jgi:oxalate---CoA ligase